MESTPFADYLQWPGLNGSLLVHALKSWAQFDWVRRHGYTPKTDTRVGSALHSFVEVWPYEKFRDLFTIMPDFANHPENVTNGRTLKDGTVKDQKPSTSVSTNWCKAQIEAFKSENEGREVLSQSEFKRVKRMLQSISQCPEAVELIEAAVFKETSVTAQINGVDCKGRIDLLRPGVLTDLKSTANIAPQAFGRVSGNLHYLLKMALYWRLLDEKDMVVDEVNFIAVQDSKPLRDGVTFNDCPDCCVIRVPIQLIENEQPRLERLLDGFKECEQFGVWPGVANHDLVVPNWAMPEEAEIDWGSVS